MPLMDREYPTTDPMGIAPCLKATGNTPHGVIDNQALLALAD